MKHYIIFLAFWTSKAKASKSSQVEILANLRACA